MKKAVIILLATSLIFASCGNDEVVNSFSEQNAECFESEDIRVVGVSQTIENASGGRLKITIRFDAGNNDNMLINMREVYFETLDENNKHSSTRYNDDTIIFPEFYLFNDFNFKYKIIVRFNNCRIIDEIEFDGSGQQTIFLEY